MQSFAALLDRLVYTPGRNAKLRLMTDYFARTPDPDRGWALAVLTDGLPFRFPVRRILGGCLTALLLLGLTLPGAEAAGRARLRVLDLNLFLLFNRFRLGRKRTVFIKQFFNLYRDLFAIFLAQDQLSS